MPEVVNPNDPNVINAILATIRQTESGNRYTAQAAGSTASGAYQITDGTWRSWCKSVGGACQYQRAVNAPPQVQDAVAAAHVQSILASNNNILESVPATWYVGFYRPGGQYWNSVPSPQAGNKATVSQYINDHWLPNYQRIATGSATIPSATNQAMIIPPGIPVPNIPFLPGGANSITDFLGQLIKPLQLLYNGLQWLSDPHNWYRVFEFIGGSILVLVGGWEMLKDTSAGRAAEQKVTTAIKTTGEVAAA